MVILLINKRVWIFIDFNKNGQGLLKVAFTVYIFHPGSMLHGGLY